MTRLMRTLVLLIVCCAVAMPIRATAATASDTYESDVLKYTNAERATRSLKALSAGRCVDKYAEAQAVKMSKAGALSHQSMSALLKACNLRAVAENVAYGYSGGKAVVAAWMASSGHRHNILNGVYRLHGVGAVKDSNGRWWVAQVFGTAK